MQVTVNDAAHTLEDGATLAELVSRLNVPEKGVAAAIGGRVVPRGAWASTVLEEGAQIVVVTAVSGG